MLTKLLTTFRINVSDVWRLIPTVSWSREDKGWQSAGETPLAPLLTIQGQVELFPVSGHAFRRAAEGAAFDQGFRVCVTTQRSNEESTTYGQKHSRNLLISGWRSRLSHRLFSPWRPQRLKLAFVLPRHGMAEAMP
jgi:hypothetical protein